MRRRSTRRCSGWHRSRGSTRRGWSSSSSDRCGCPVAPPALLYLNVTDLRGLVERLRAQGVRIDTEPVVIFTHEDGTLGPAGHQEWHAFVRDSEDNLVGLVEHVPVG